jgi:hypothetical protein
MNRVGNEDARGENEDFKANQIPGIHGLIPELLPVLKGTVSSRLYVPCLAWLDRGWQHPGESSQVALVLGGRTCAALASNGTQRDFDERILAEFIFSTCIFCAGI